MNDRFTLESLLARVHQGAVRNQFILNIVLKNMKTTELITTIV